MRRGIAIVLLSSGLALSAGGCGGPAQIGPDRDVFKAVDALYTAVSLRESKLVDQCAKTLGDLESAGKLPGDAGSSLRSIIDDAKSGRWEPSQERLARFMEGQRR